MTLKQLLKADNIYNISAIEKKAGLPKLYLHNYIRSNTDIPMYVKQRVVNIMQKEAKKYFELSN